MDVAKAVRKSYGGDYTECITYLERLALNRFYLDASLPRLTWHETVSPAPNVGAPVYRLHPTVVETLASSVPLRAAFGGRRDE